jgi:hypothetical protein
MERLEISMDKIALQDAGWMAFELPDGREYWEKAVRGYELRMIEHLPSETSGEKTVLGFANRFAVVEAPNLEACAKFMEDLAKAGPNMASVLPERGGETEKGTEKG